MNNTSTKTVLDKTVEIIQKMTDYYLMAAKLCFSTFIHPEIGQVGSGSSVVIVQSPNNPPPLWSNEIMSKTPCR